ncbi:MAG: polymer-forming cytoskeletal protein, partial [Pseudomonadota bacterium]
MRRRSAGPTTLIADGCVIEGQIGGTNDVLVSGTVVGDSTLQGLVTIAASGHWRGSLQAEDIIISGRVDGDLKATGCIEIAASAEICGSVVGARIAVAEGAVIDGELKIAASAEIPATVPATPPAPA